MLMTVPTERNKVEQLLRIIAPNSRLLHTWRLQGGISAEMTAFEIEHADGHISKMILRQPGEQTLRRNPHAAEDEFKILQLTESLGLPTPTPYYLDSSATIFPLPYLVIEYVDGKPELIPSPGADFTFQLAKHLAQIHSVDCSNNDISFLPKQANQCGEIAHNQITNIDLSLDDGNLRSAVEEALPFTQRNAQVLLHGDYWPGNILWHDERLIAVVDWEDARLGDPLVDLAISRLDILTIFGIDSMRSFTHHYQSLMNIDYTNLPYWDLCAALRLARLIGSDLADWVAFFEPHGRYDITEQTFRKHFRFFIRQAFEKLSLTGGT
jgi:aminoglycoside phosphotransferase (APT) family kinase protein